MGFINPQLTGWHVPTEWTNSETWETYRAMTEDAGVREYWMYEAERCHAGAASPEEARELFANRARAVFQGTWQTAMQTDCVLTARTCKVLYSIGSLWRVDWLEIAAAFLGEEKAKVT